MLRYLLLLVLILPNLVFAAAPGAPPTGGGNTIIPSPYVVNPQTGSVGGNLANMATSGPSLFNPPPTDLSFLYLSDIFGVVDGVLHGSGSQIMGAMFGVFNAAILTLGAIVAMYTLIVSTLNTAHQGQVLGEKWSSVWIPVRTVLGFALMAPKASGYSFIQIFVMWVVVQGIGAADTVWNAALTYLARGGTIIQASNPGALGLTNTSKLINPISGDIFKSQVCMYGVYNSLTNHAADNSAYVVTYPEFTGTVQVTGVTTKMFPPSTCPLTPGSKVCSQPSGTNCDCQAMVEFPGATAVSQPPGGGQGTSYEAVCGNVTWDIAMDQGGGLAGQAPGATSPFGAINNPSNIGIYNANGTPVTGGQVGGGSDSRSIAVQQMVLDLQPLAQAVANVIVPPAGIQNQSGQPSTLTQLQNLLGENTIPGAQTTQRNDVAGAAVDYMGIMLPYLATLAQGANQDAINLLNNNKTTGWILAGSYYYQLVSLNKQYSAMENDYPNSTYSGDFSGCPTRGGNLCVKDYQVLGQYLLPGDVSCATNISPSTDPLGANICWNTQNIPQASPGNTGGQIIGTTGLIVGIAILGPLAPSMAIVLGALLDIANHVNALTASNADPLIAIANLGNVIVNWVEMAWFLGTISIFLTSLVMSVMQCMNPLGMAYATALMWFLPLMIAILMTMLVAGATMAYYVPLIPFIIFLFASVGWFAVVIEAMIAAPLVALGIANPEGHDVFGQAQNSVMILANVFLRPTLIIIGFLSAAILSHVALWLVNQGFVNVMPSEQHDLFQIFSIVVITVIYVGLVLTVMNRCFALIHEIPSKVLRWIGGTPEDLGEAGYAEKVSGYAGAAAQPMSTGMGAAPAGAEKGGAQMGAIAKTETGPGDIGASSSAKGGGDSGKGGGQGGGGKGVEGAGKSGGGPAGGVGTPPPVVPPL